jgi:hypothetical protein
MFSIHFISFLSVGMLQDGMDEQKPEVLFPGPPLQAAPVLIDPGSEADEVSSLRTHLHTCQMLTTMQPDPDRRSVKEEEEEVEGIDPEQDPELAAEQREIEELEVAVAVMKYRARMLRDEVLRRGGFDPRDYPY